MTKKKKVKEKASSQSKRLSSGKKGKKEQENPVTQAKMFCTEAASHEKGGNYNRALHCYNLLENNAKNKMNDVEDTAVNSTNGDEESENVENLTGRDECESKDDETTAEKKPEAGVGKKPKKKGRKAKHTGEKSKNAVAKKKVEVKPPSPRISAKSAFAQIAKELKAKRIAQMQYAAAMAKKRKKNRVLRDEEIYTDKDRAAAVNLGTRDIKQSLKMKKKQDKVPGSQIPEEAEPGTLLAMGNNELRNGDLKNALNFMNKALELNPDDKNGLVARSKCYLSLGDPQLALKDAETALQSDKTFVRAIFQKAEALYHLGDFEHSLMYYHRGHRLRPELECFRLGVQKAQEAIENTIGSTAGLRNRRSDNKVPSSASSSIKTGESNKNEKSSTENESGGCWSSVTSDGLRRRRSKSAAPTMKTSTRRFLGELGADRQYLENLLNHPDLSCCNEEAANIIRAQAEEGISFLKSRQEFWRQQRPNTSVRKSMKNE